MEQYKIKGSQNFNFVKFNVHINAFLISVLGSYLTQPKVANLATLWEWETVDEINVIILMTSNHPPR